MIMITSCKNQHVDMSFFAYLSALAVLAARLTCSAAFGLTAVPGRHATMVEMKRCGSGRAVLQSHSARRCFNARLLCAGSNEEAEVDRENSGGSSGRTPPDLIKGSIGTGRRLRRGIGSAVRQISGAPDQRASLFIDEFEQRRTSGADRDADEGPMFIEGDYIPEVLVIGALGNEEKTGILIVRKLLLRGFRVRVIVPNLLSETLAVFGNSVSYTVGDLSSLALAVDDVDKIIIAAEPPGPAVADGKEDARQPHRGIGEWSISALQNVLRAYQDARVQEYGLSGAVKRKLFVFSNAAVRDVLWSLEPPIQDPVEEAEAALAASVSSAASATTFDGDGGIEEATGSGDNNVGKVRRYASWKASGDGEKAVLVGNAVREGDDKAMLAEPGAAPARRRRARRVSAACAPLSRPLDLSRYSGLFLRVGGDGRHYTLFLRTSDTDDDDVQYEATFATSPSGGWRNVRVPFSRLRAVRRSAVGAGEDVNDAGANTVRATARSRLNLRRVRQIGVAYEPCRTGTAAANAEAKVAPWRSSQYWGGRNTEKFYLSIKWINAYRMAEEPEIVYLSSAQIPADATLDDQSTILRQLRNDDDARHRACSEHSSAATRPVAAEARRAGEENDDEMVAAGRGSATSATNGATEAVSKARGELAVRTTGLTYTIIRTHECNDAVDTVRGLALDQRGAYTMGGASVSRAALADLAITALLEPRARNIIVYASDRRFAPEALLSPVTQASSRRSPSSFEGLRADTMLLPSDDDDDSGNN